MIEFSIIENEKEALKAVECNGDALRYVKEQSEAVCLKAVERNGDALRFVKERSLFVKIALALKIKVDIE